MCDGERPSAWSETWRTARKEHRCCSCNERIRAGQRYHYCGGVWDGTGASYKHCARCWTLFHALVNYSGEESVDLLLDCGETWDSLYGEPPPEELAALAFLTPAEAQELDEC